MALAPDIKKDLGQEVHTEFHQALLEHCMKRVKLSSEHMVKYHAKWDRLAETTAGERKRDQEDVRASKLKEPEKMVVPLSKAQTHTFVSFLFLYFQQKQYAFEYMPQDRGDYRIRELCEKLVHRDLYVSKWPVVLYQALLDAARFNLGVIEHTWATNVQKFAKTTITDQEVVGISWPTEKETMEDVITFQGNKVYAISPYKFYPDPRVSLTNIHCGEFVAVEEEKSRTELRQLEHEGVIAGVKHIKDFSSDLFDKNFRSNKRNSYVRNSSNSTTADRRAENCDMVNVIRLQIKIVPADFKVEGKPLGKEKFPVQWIVWIANDQRVIRAEPAGRVNTNFSLEVIQFDPDNHYFLGKGLAEIIDKLQETITWLINSHILNVRRHLDHQLIFDETLLDAKKLQSRSPIIPMKRSPGRTRIQDSVMQLQISDVTGRHMEDVGRLIELVKLVSGINESAMGGVTKGRRPATEHNAANQGSSARMRTIGATIFTQGLGPMAHNLLTTLRQGLSREQFDRAVGTPDPSDLMAIAKHEQDWIAFKADPAHLATASDYFVMDLLNPNDKSAMAASLGELFKVIMSVPDAAQAFDIDPGSVFREIMELRGGGDLRRHSLSANQAEQMQVQQAMAQAALPAPADQIEQPVTPQPEIA